MEGDDEERLLPASSAGEFHSEFTRQQSVTCGNVKELRELAPAHVSRGQYACVLLFTGTCYTAAMSIFALLGQFVYHRYAVEMGLPGGGMNDNVSECSTNTSDPMFILQMQVQQVTSDLNLKTSLTIGCINIVAIMVMGAYSDRLGRRLSIIIPWIGVAITIILLSVWMVLELPMWVYIVAQIPGACTGSYSAIVAATFSLISDSTSGSERSLYIAILDTTLGICYMASSLITGWLIRWFDFNWPFYGMACLLLFSGVFLLGIPETSPVALHRNLGKLSGAAINAVIEESGSGVLDGDPLPPHVEPTQEESMTPWRMLKMSLQVFAVDVHRGILLGMMLFSLFTYQWYWLGSTNVSTLLLLNQPFCWNSVKLGIYNALSALLCQLGTVFIITVFRKRVNETWLIALGFLSIVLSLLGSAVATQIPQPWCGYIMLICVPVGMFAGLVTPMTRTVISKLVSEYEQGVVFGSMASLEGLAIMVGSIACSAIYESTVSFFPGMVNLVLAALLSIGLVITKIFYCLTHGGTEKHQCPEMDEDDEPTTN